MINFDGSNQGLAKAWQQNRAHINLWAKIDSHLEFISNLIKAQMRLVINFCQSIQVCDL